MTNKIKEAIDKICDNGFIESSNSKSLDKAKNLTFGDYKISRDKTVITMSFRDTTKVGGKIVMVNFYSVKEIVID